MSHHLDTPLAAQNGQLYIDDLYVFSGDSSTVFIMDVNSNITGVHVKPHGGARENSGGARVGAGRPSGKTGNDVGRLLGATDISLSPARIVSHAQKWKLAEAVRGPATVFSRCAR
jgi:hypothetical protein